MGVVGATRVLPNRSLGVASLAGVALAVLGFALQPILGATIALMTMPAVVGFFGWSYARRQPVRLDVTSRGLVVDGRLVRNELLFGVKASRTAKGLWQVDLDDWFGVKTRLEVPSVEDARVLLRALGRDPRVGTSIFRVRVPWLPSAVAFAAMLVAVLGILAAAAANVAAWWMLGGPLLALGFVLAQTRSSSVHIGTDGITVDGRFVPFTAIARIGPEKAGSGRVEITLASGERIDLDAAPALARDAEENHVRTRIEAAWALARAKPAEAVVPLLRGERSTRDWIASLRAGDPQYRVAAVDDDALLRVVTDAASSREARAAAAVALAAKGEVATKLRVAADDVADPVVRRVALAALDDEAQLEAELEAAIHAK